MRRRISPILAAPLLVIALGGCGMLGGGSPGGGEEPQAGAEEQPPAAQQSAPPQGGKPIATKEVKSKGATLRVDVTELRRDGGLANLSWDVTVEDGEKWSVWTVFGGGGLDFTVSGVSLVDTANAKRYRVARSAGEDGDCVCTKGTNQMEPAKGEAVSFQATFAAPPPQVTKVNVNLAELGGLTGVPIS